MNRFGTRIGLWLLRIYQFAISPLLGPACRFEPSCSHYAAGALERYGLFNGGLLAIRRVVRCHPFGESGYDPVPRRVTDGS